MSTAAAVCDRISVVLVATRNPLNIGAAARAMSNFGCADLRVVRPYELAFREARSAVGASELLASARLYDNVADAVADCSLVVGTTAGRDRELQHALRPLPEAAGLIRATLASARVALLFGSEKRGLANEDLSHCDWLTHIPTRSQHVSMNLGQAVAVCLYELARSDDAAPAPTSAVASAVERSSAGTLERMTATLLDALRASGYLKAPTSPAAEEKMRRLVHRMDLTAEDAETWLGMLRQILWKLRAVP